jgi:hypothetical protein
VREGCCKGLRIDLGLKDKAQATDNDFNNKTYRHELDESTGFCGPHHFMHLFTHYRPGVSPMKKAILFSCVGILSAACGGKPSGTSDAFYEEYKLLGAPKILYQCGDQIGYSAGVGMNATYNHIVGEAKEKCNEKFKLLDSQQYAADKR